MYNLVIFQLTIIVQVFTQQLFEEPPTNQEVGPGEDVILSCVIVNKVGECRWEKDGTPVGIYNNKYEWAHPEEKAFGDCSLHIKNASFEYDNGVWQCQVTASDFTQKDTLISDGAEVLVRGMTNIT